MQYNSSNNWLVISVKEIKVELKLQEAIKNTLILRKLQKLGD
jgi:hypothetical protein